MRRQVHHSRKYPLLNDATWLRERYEVEEKTMKEIAALVGGCSVALVLGFLRKHGIVSRKGRAAWETAKVTCPRKFPELHDRDWLAVRHAAGKTATDVANELGCSVSLACRAVRRAGLIEPEPEDISLSPNYGRTELVKDEAWLRKQYLGLSRKAAAIARELCVPPWVVHDALAKFRILRTTPETHNKTRRRRDGETVGRADGYVRIFLPTHPSATSRGYIKQHRYVAEQAAGRILTKTEQVHHINECRHDNRLENLLVMPDYRSHVNLHHNQPPWVPRCVCCGNPCPERVAARPAWVPLVYDAAATYQGGPEFTAAPFSDLGNVPLELLVAEVERRVATPGS